MSETDSGCLTKNLLCLYSIQDIAILFSVIIILLMMFNTYVFQVGLVFLLLERFRALLIISALYLTLSICFHCWVLVGNITGTYMPMQFKWNSCIIAHSQVQYWPSSISNGHHDHVFSLLEPQMVGFKSICLDRWPSVPFCFPKSR